MTNVDAPNNPERSGSSGSEMFEFRAAIPKNPASANIIVVIKIAFFLRVIRKIEVQIRKNPSICWMNGYILGIRNVTKGVIAKRSIIESIEPVNVRRTA